MATYQFSALADGQAISFSPNTDLLNFDQTAIAAADIRVSVSGSNVVVTYLATGKDVTLLNVTPLQLATSNVTFANGSQLLFGDNTAGTAADNSANSLTGTAGNDLLQGFGGADTMNGGAGNDTYIVGTGDVLSDSGGIDTVVTDITWSLGTTFENLTMTGTANITMQGNNLDNLIIGNAGNNTFNARAGNDTIQAGAGNDRIDMFGNGFASYGDEVVDGGAGFDNMDFSGYAKSSIVVDLGAGTVVGGGDGGLGTVAVSNVEMVITGAFDDRITGSANAESFDGRGGNDTIAGRAGNDTLAGGTGNDVFVFDSAPGATNVDRITDFVSAADKLQFDNSVFSAIGAAGSFAAGDGRFWAAAGATAGHDANDRLVYNTSTGSLYYDADGSGSGAAILIATLQSGATLAATDIAVTGNAPGQMINGGPGNDSLTGGSGGDTINGFEGNDTLDGGAGNDSLIGGPGDDTLIGGDGNDTLVGGPDWGDSLSGGLGDDTYYVAGWPFAVIAPDPGGIDTVFSEDAWDLGEGLENLTLIGTGHDNRWANGNNLDNIITGNADDNSLSGLEGNDTLRGGDGNDNFEFHRGLTPIDYGSDVVEGGAGFDQLSFWFGGSGITLDFAAGTVTGGGSGGSGSVTFTSIESVVGSDFADQMDAGGSPAAMVFNGRDGNDTLTGAGAADSLRGGRGDDRLIGGGGNDLLLGEGGSDFIDGGAGDDLIDFADTEGPGGQDTVNGGDGNDTLQLSGSAYVDLGAGIAGDTPGSSNRALLSSVEHVLGTWGADTLIGSAGANLLDGGFYHDSIDGAGGDDTVRGGSENDTLRGGEGSDRIEGGDGDDWIVVDAGTDTVVGGAGIDRILFDQAPSAANADIVTDFTSGEDELVFDTAAFAAVGQIGNFLPGDARFYAAPGATSGHDATDRVIYDTASGRVFYDADGSGAGAAVLLVTLQGAPAFSAPDIHVMGDGVSGVALTGTAGHDHLEGGSGNDSLQGLAGNDTLVGNQNHDELDGGKGSDSMLGGDGNDTLTGGTDDWWETYRDTMDGGLGDDTYIIGRGITPDNTDQVVLRDAGGTDTIVTQYGDWILGAGFENLELGFDFADEGFNYGEGNELDNVITGFQGWWVWNTIDGADGNDTLIGGDGDDTFAFAAGSGNIGQDSIDGGFGVDWLNYSSARSAVTVDLRAGTASGGGNGGSGGVVVVNVEAVSGSSFDDVLIAGDIEVFGEFGSRAPVLYGAGGNDTLIGGAAADLLAGDRARTAVFVEGQAFGDDWLDGRAGNDTLSGGSGADTFAFTAAAGSANADTISDFQSGIDTLRLDTTTYAALGAQGRLVAGDERFHAAAGATAGHDATDRIVYDTTTGNLYYDADGNGAGAALLIATVSPIAATDIVVGMTDAGAPGQNATASSGDDALFGTAGDDTLDGLAGNDLLRGNAGRDALFGRDGNDTLDGGGGNDTLDGGAGNDTYFVRSFSDVLIDSGGIDTVIVDASLPDYALRPGFENLTLQGTEGQGIGNELGNLIDASAGFRVHLEGRAGNDTLIGTDAGDPASWNTEEQLFGGEGDDHILGRGGADFAEGGLGADFIAGGDGNDALYGGRPYWLFFSGDGNDTIEGGAGADHVEGGEGDDVLRGDAGNDLLWGMAGADTMSGGDGDDTIALWDFGVDGAHDLIEGGAGSDTVDFFAGGSQFGTGVPLIIDLQSGSITSRYSWWTPSATLVSIENVQGTTGSDLILGSSGANFLMGDGGQDTLDGGEGNDSLLGSGGFLDMNQDVFVFSVTPGAANADVIQNFVTGADTIQLDARVMSALGASGYFSTADARFHAAAGATGGHDADDRVVFNTSTGQLFYDADGSGAGAAQLLFTLQSGAAVAADIEIVNGGAPAPRLVFSGTAGDDTLQGGNGDDVLAGGTGRDVLTGGAGADRFLFREAPAAGNADRITDFISGTDDLQLDAAVMPALGRAGELFNGDGRFWSAAGATGGHDADDRIVYDTATGNVYYDPDGNGTAAAQLVVTLQPGAALAVGDIVVEGHAPQAEPAAEILHPPLSGDLRIDALIGNYVAWERLTPGDEVIQYTFSTAEGRQLFGPEDIVGFNASLQDATRQVLAHASAITGIVFEEVADGNAADLHFANSPIGEFGLLGVFSWDDAFEFDANGTLTSYQADGYVYLDNFTDATPGTFEYQVLLHEVGHALGLKHPHDFPVQLLPGDDNNSNTVMTYEDSFEPQDEFQEFDIAALHWLYGGDGLGGAGARASGTPPTFGTRADEFLNGGEGHDLLWGDSGEDTLLGGGGNDWVLGGAQADYLDGGAGDDRYAVTAGDVLVDSGGIDTVYSEVSWTLAAGFENLRFQFVYEDGESMSGTGNDLANVISGNQGNNLLTGLEGDDSLYGWGADDVFAMSFTGSSYGNDFIDGGFGVDTVDFSGGTSAAVVDLGAGSATGGGTSGAGAVQLVRVESVVGTAFADRIVGNGEANTLHGGGGRDTLTGAGGLDVFLFAAALAAANADLITDFGADDALSFDARTFGRIGSASFVASDVRFHAAAGAVAGQDADDRIVYDSSTGNLYYDADGSGSGAAVLVATLQGAPTLSAAQIDVLNGRTEPGVNLAGTAAAESFSGGAGEDTLAAGAGNDTLSGMDGADSLSGGDGNDSLDGGGGVDTLDGGLGDDSYVSDGDVIVDAGGVDTVILSGGPGATLASGIENLVVAASYVAPAGVADIAVAGNEAANVIRILATGDRFVVSGGAGNDTLLGGGGNERFSFGGSYGDDSVDGGTGFDWLVFGDDAAAMVDFGAGTASGGGSGSVRFTNVEAAAGGSRDDRLTAGAAGVHFVGAAGNDTLAGGAGSDRLDSETGSDQLSGGGGNDTLAGGAGSDTLTGGLGMDRLWGSGEEGEDGADLFVFDVAPGGADADTIFDFQQGIDKLQLDSGAMPALGASGPLAAADARFWASATGAAHDADDRVLYNTSTGQLWYDADGNGAAAAQLIATLQGAPTLAATDIAIAGAATPTTINGTAGPDSLTGGAGHDTINGLDGNDTINGLDGDDSLNGGAGTDSMNGGLGDDTYVVTAGDVLVDSGGIDTVVADITWSLGTAFENLTMTGTGNITMQGNNLNNLIIGNSGNNTFNARAGDDTIMAGGGNDRIDMFGNGFPSYGNEVVDGGAGIDSMDFSGYAKTGITVNLATGQVTGGGDAGSGTVAVSNVETVITGAFNDRFTGSSAANTFDGRGGNDTLGGGAGNDTLTGGTGQDFFVFENAPAAANVDRVTDFVSATDKLALENSVFTAIGTTGNFAAADGRFWAAAGATAGHDASDRVVYNTSTGSLYYDADGSGSGAAQLIATFQGNPAIAATDITVI